MHLIHINEILCISLYPHRFAKLKRLIPNLTLVPGVRPADLTHTERQAFAPAFLLDHPGHCGATAAHMRAWQMASDISLILEDDVDIPGDFVSRANDMIHRVTSRDPHWDILLFGFAADIAHHPAVAWNTDMPTNGGIARIQWFAGMWAYAIRRRMMPPKLFTKTLEQQLCETPNLRIYGCVPNIAFHPGTYRLTPWGLTYRGRGDPRASDTRENK